MGLVDWFENVLFHRKVPLSLRQLQDLVNLEMKSIHKKKHLLEILPGKDHKEGRPVYMIVRFKGEVLGKAFTNRFEKIMSKSVEIGFDDADVVKIERYIKDIKEICNPRMANLSRNKNVD